MPLGFAGFDGLNLFFLFIFSEVTIQFSLSSTLLVHFVYCKKQTWHGSGMKSPLLLAAASKSESRAADYIYIYIYIYI
jgi:hypothetical protein